MLINLGLKILYGVLTSIISFLVYAGDLESWNEGPLEYVDQVTKSSKPHFIPEEERIAVFDNDGTLWTEKPVPVQLQFAVGRARKLPPKHPEWKKKQPFKATLEDDKKYLSQATA